MKIAYWSVSLLFFSVSDGKRSSGLTAVWVARNRFAVLDKTHTVIHWSVCLSVCPSICLSVHLSVCPSIYLSIRRSVCLSFCASVGLSVCLYVGLSIDLSVPSVPVCLSLMIFVTLFDIVIFPICSYWSRISRMKWQRRSQLRFVITFFTLEQAAFCCEILSLSPCSMYSKRGDYF